MQEAQAAKTLAEPSIAEVKQTLPVQYVLHRAGLVLDEAGSCICPFHDDHAPSLDTFSPNRWNCAPCGLGGDVIDLLRAFAPDLDFQAVMAWAARLLSEMEDGWTAEAGERPAFNVEEGSAVVGDAHGNTSGVYTFSRTKGYPFRGAYLRSWGVGSIGDRLVIPYWSRDGQLRTYRTRSILGTDKPKSAFGSHEPTFYGEWRDMGYKDVLICEGESDTWVANWALENEFDVLGVPGAGRAPFGIEQLEGRTIHLAFDGDAAGAAATARWEEYLKEQCVISHCLSDGRDVASLSVEDIRALVGCVA